MNLQNIKNIPTAYVLKYFCTYTFFVIIIIDRNPLLIISHLDIGKSIHLKSGLNVINKCCYLNIDSKMKVLIAHGIYLLTLVYLPLSKTNFTN